MNNEGSPASDLTVTLSAISTELLRAELRTRQDDNSEHVRPVCGSGAKGVYNTPLHVFALFLILVLSVAGSYWLDVYLHTLQYLTALPSSMRLPSHCPTIPIPTSPASLPLPLAPLWHGRPHRNSLLPSPTNSLHLPNRPLSTTILERTIYSNARTHSHDVRVYSNRYRNVLCNTRCRPLS